MIPKPQTNKQTNKLLFLQASKLHMPS